MSRYRAFKVALLSVMALTACDPVDLRDPASFAAYGIMFHGAGVVETHSSLELDARTEGRFARFVSEKNAYGALYVAANGEGWGAQQGSVSLDDAKRVARATCLSSGNVGCTLYATAVPSKQVSANSLPNMLRPHITDALRATAQNAYIATALSPSGRTATVRNQNDEATAKAASLQACRENVETQSREIGRSSFTALQSRGLTECRVVLVIRKR